ncbi:hypothetical protein CONPUDRAFT_162934 [Coniophora puteana RWD-64-598 SS2]|uniref:Velvet domain-containing protein n=1 Tax=Coniophora puteana (strain RWD-64-598) TaxID=741705 RepID=A0A5M3N3I6_CONPW|nr:uncharacterized protein CONPUDRAFT_162934 [Coniophora puteana RWD-64-598 SS2]EIW85867.1 hypothetical protein CONPUDRAFT_162934 [Coniophora puteana RWD-64-598 SS2]
MPLKIFCVRRAEPKTHDGAPDVSPSYSVHVCPPPRKGNPPELSSIDPAVPDQRTASLAGQNSEARPARHRTRRNVVDAHRETSTVVSEPKLRVRNKLGAIGLELRLEQAAQQQRRRSDGSNGFHPRVSPDGTFHPQQQQAPSLTPGEGSQQGVPSYPMHLGAHGASLPQQPSPPLLDLSGYPLRQQVQMHPSLQPFLTGGEEMTGMKFDQHLGLPTPPRLLE